MQDLIDAAVEKGKEQYDIEQRKKIVKDASSVLAEQWVTEELPDRVTAAVKQNPECTELILKSTYYKNKHLSDELISHTCNRLGLKTRLETGCAPYYEDGPPEDFVNYYLIF